MKRKLCVLSLLSISLLCSCKMIDDIKNGDEIVYEYPDFGYANDKSDSWLQRDDEEISINWYVDLSSFGTSAVEGTKVGDLIFQKTGIHINYVTPITDDGSKLSTMLSSGKLPDIITVGGGGDTRIQLGEEGYTYPIEELATRYAPTLLNRIDKDISNFFKQSDGCIHGLPNHFYTQSDLNAYEEQEGKKLLSNGAMLCRKDYLDAYIAANPTANPTTPSGFKEMCQWVKNTYKLNNANPTFMLDSFDKKGSDGLIFLQEYFNVPKEDSNGNLLDLNRTERNKEMFMWLNDLYRSNLISSANFSNTKASLGTYIAKGMAFAFVGSPQLYTNYFKQAYRNGIEYVPVVMTNKDGEAPQLRSLAGNGWLFSMITTKCARPDRVIKLFDFLFSEEGQSIFYGIKDEDFTYTIEPGGKAQKQFGSETKEIQYKYGLIEYKENVWQDIISEDVGKYGFGYSNVLVNPMYPRLTSPQGEVLNSMNDYFDYNNKAALTDFTFYNGGFEYTRDATRDNFIDIVNKSNNISNLWGQYCVQIITAASESESLQILESTINRAKSMGADDVLAFDNEDFQKNKENLNLTFAWPKNDPTSGYSSLKVTSIYGNTSYAKTIPEVFK